MNNDTPLAEAAAFFADVAVGKTEQCVSADFARDLKRENAQLREALKVAERELVHLFTVLPISGTLPSPCVMQHIQWALLPNPGDEGADK